MADIFSPDLGQNCLQRLLADDNRFFKILWPLITILAVFIYIMKLTIVDQKPVTVT